MAMNNIDSQFAIARAEVRALIDHCNSNTTIGGRSIDVLQSIVDTLDAIQNDSYKSSESFHRYPVAVDQGIATLGHEFGFEEDEEDEDRPLGDPPLIAKPDFNLSSGFVRNDRKALEEMRQTDRLC